MKYKNFLPLTVVAAMASVALPALAAPPPPPPPPGAMPPPPPPPSMMRPLPLPAVIMSHAHPTPEQADKIAGVMHANRDKMVAMHEEVKAIDEKIDGLVLSNGKIDQEALNALVKQKLALHEQAEMQRVAELVAIHDILTPSQRADVQKSYSEVHKLMMKLRELMAPPPPPKP